MKFACIFVMVLALSMTSPVLAEETRPVENLSRLIDTAVADNPELKASEARWQVFRNKVSQVRSLDDPMLTLKIQNGIFTDPLNFGKDSMTQKVIGISQQLPFWGKRGLKGEVAEQEAESYRFTLAERKLELARMVKENYYQIYSIDKALIIVDKNLKILEEFTTLAETRYAVGKGSQQDIFKAQLEHSRLLDQHLALEQLRRSLESNLNALLSRPTGTPVGKIPDFAIAPPAADNDRLRNIAEDNRPLLQSYRALMKKGEAGRALAAKESYPDFNVFFEYMQRDPANGEEGLDMYSLGVTFNLPLHRERRHAMVAEASAETTMANEELNAARNTIAAGIGDLLAQLDRRRKQIELYRTGIIPQAEKSLESASIGYQVGKVDFLTLLDSRVTLFNYERELYDSMADYQIRRAQLEAVVGKEL